MPACPRQVATSAAFIGLLAVGAQVAGADPITFRIVQSGWNGGGQVVGTFTGEDIDRDATLTLDAGESDDRLQ